MPVQRRGVRIVKRILSALVVMAMLLACLGTALAETWYCPNCGSRCDSNFCPSCGTRKPSSGSNAASIASTISSVSVSQQENGDTLVSWSASGTGPYKVTYTTEEWQVSYYDQQSYAGSSATLRYLVPGAIYTIKVTDTASGASKSTTYTEPMLVYREFKTGNKYLKLSENSFSIQALERNPVNTFELQVLWPQLSHSRLYVAKLALKTPLGYTSGTHLWDPFKLDRYTAGIAYTYSMSTDWLERIQSDFGYIPTGTYTFEFYLNGQLYDYVSVPVRN